MTMDGVGALASNGNQGLLSLLASLMGLGNDTSMASLAYMNSLGTINPAVFGQTDPSIIRQLLPGGNTLARDQLLQNQNQFNMNNQLDWAKFGMANQMAQQDMGLQRDDMALRRELGLGNLDIAREQSAVQKLLGLKQADVMQGRLDLDSELGRNQQAMDARQMLSQRATRQLVAPGGRTIPSMVPMIGPRI